MLLNSCEISSDGVFIRTVSHRLCGEAECYFTTHSNVLAVVPSSTAVAQRAPPGTLASRPFPQRAFPRAPSAAFVLVVGVSTFVCAAGSCSECSLCGRVKRTVRKSAPPLERAEPSAVTQRADWKMKVDACQTRSAN